MSHTNIWRNHCTFAGLSGVFMNSSPLGCVTRFTTMFFVAGGPSSGRFEPTTAWKGNSTFPPSATTRDTLRVLYSFESVVEYGETCPGDNADCTRGTCLVSSPPSLRRVNSNSTCTFEYD